MRKTLLLSTVALTVCAFAEQSFEQHELVAAAKKNGTTPLAPLPPPASTQTEVRPGYPTVNPQPTLTSARAKSEYGGYLFTDVLYWHADVSNTDWAGKNKNTTTNTVPIIQDNHQMKFKWDWAFRIGVGMDLKHDQWDTNFYYTWFQTDISNSAGTKRNQSLTVLNNHDTFSVSQGKNHWKIHYSMFDIDLGRWFYVSNFVALRPHLGLKGGWIHQKYHSFWDQRQQNRTYQQEFKNDFWGIGASGGVNSQWTMAFYKTNAFNLFCDLAGALMYGRFGISFDQKFYAGKTLTFNFPISHLDRHLVVPMLQAMLGFGWNTPLYSERYHLGVKLGYEFQYWFRQLHKVSKIQPFGISGTVVNRYSLRADPLAIQGLTLDFRFDY